MNLFLSGMARAVAESFELPEPILEIGSYQVAGQEACADLRRYFPGREYIGLDLRPGLGVDQIGDVEQLPFPDGSIGTVLALSTFEHVQRFWKGFDEIYRVLRPDGALLVSCPFYFHVHDYPGDYWRFTPQALDLLLEAYPSRLTGWHGPRSRPINVWSLAFREERGPLQAAEIACYRELMTRYAREPLPWRRELRYRLGRILFGSRPFAPHLLRDSWECQIVGAQAARPSVSTLREMSHVS